MITNTIPSHRAGAAAGQRQDALAAIEETAAVYNRLAAARPDELRHDLATASAHLASVLSALWAKS